MTKKKNIKMISIVLLIITLFSNIGTVAVQASTEIQSADLKYIKDCGDYLQAKDGEWYTIVASYVEYTAPDGNKYPAYCLDNTKPGVGNPAIGDLPEGYTVNVSKILDNDKVYRAVINGYPYKTPSQLGVKDKYDAYIATKQAIYSVLYDYNVETRYRGVNERGENIKSAIAKIVKIAREGTQTQSSPLIKFEKIGNFGEDTINSLYYSQTYNVTSDVQIKEYSITSTKGFPAGSIITDVKNNKKTTFFVDEQFKVLIPKSSVKNSNIEGSINAQVKCKSYPVFYGEKNKELQPYAITYDVYGDSFGETSLSIKMNTGKVKINKIDEDTKSPISGVTFQIQKGDGTVVTNSTTGKDGIAIFSNLFPGSYKLKEISTNASYEILDEEFDIGVEYNKTTEQTVTNKLKKGQIRIIKVDKDNKDIKLEGVELEVLDENDNVLEKLITDKNGEALTDKYPIRDFSRLKIRETKTLEEYKLSDEVKIVELEANKITDVVFKNEKIKGQIKIVKTSSDDNFINGTKAGSPIQDVKFQIYDVNQNIVDEIITDEQGIAISKELYKGLYTVKEVESGKWYLLNDEVLEVEIKENNEVVELNMTNKSEKPSVEIDKTGIDKAIANQEIRYDFYIKNTGNVPLDNFTWIDKLPYDYVKITRLSTGTYNQNLNYSIYYKTNLNDYKLLAENLNTQTNHMIDFFNIKLEKGEVITEFKVDFGTVNTDFKSVINPYIFTTVKSNVKKDDTFTNKTRIEGENKTYIVWDEAEYTTKVYKKEIKLPRTGF